MAIKSSGFNVIGIAIPKRAERNAGLSHGFSRLYTKNDGGRGMQLRIILNISTLSMPKRLLSIHEVWLSHARRLPD